MLEQPLAAIALSRSQLKRNALKRDNYTCQNCGALADHAHHVVPLARGGNDLISNLVSLCGRCHGGVHGVDWTHHRELTCAGLAAAKARGVKLGGIRPNTIKENIKAKNAAMHRAEALRPLIAPMVAARMTLRQISAALADAGKLNRKGEPLAASQVSRILDYLGLAQSGR